MEKEVEEAWLIKATHLGDYDDDSMWYVLYGVFLYELKHRVWLLRTRAVSTAHDIADDAYYFGLTSSVYPDIDGFITPADTNDLVALYPEDDVSYPDPIPVGDKFENVIGLAQKDVWRFGGGAAALYVSGLTPFARLDVTTRCGTSFRIDLPPQWFDELTEKQAADWAKKTPKTFH